MSDPCDRTKRRRLANRVKTALDSITSYSSNRIKYCINRNIITTAGSIQESLSSSTAEVTSTAIEGSICTVVGPGSSVEVSSSILEGSSSTVENSNSFISINDSFSFKSLQNPIDQNTKAAVIPIRTSLAQWAIKHNITHAALRELIPVIKSNDDLSNLPLDPRTLLNTPNTVKKYKMGEGLFSYFGLKSEIMLRIRDGESNKIVQLPDLEWIPRRSPQLITVTIGIDGLPVSRSSNSQFWPILGAIDQSNRNEPFLIALYFGKTKPESIDIFLKDFVEEIVDLEENGVTVNEIMYPVRVRCIVADAPARDFIKGCSSFNGYQGCERCKCKGSWRGRVVFLDLNSPLRKDQDAVTDKSHFIKPTPLKTLKLGLVSQFPLDYMHLTCLGVMRKLLHAWTKKIPFRLQTSVITQISMHLTKISPHIPSEFNRKPRSLRELDHFKATEFRLILLYTGIVVFKNRLPKEKYVHFLKFSTAMHIVLTKGPQNEEWCSFAESLFKTFVLDAAKLYNKEFIVYNVHSLIHIVEDYRNFGSLDNVSAFKFENYMQTLKRMVRSKSQQLEQVVNRVSEIKSIGHTEQTSLRNVRSGELLIPSIGLVSSRMGDSCFLTKNGDVVICMSLIQEDYFYCNTFRIKIDLPHFPCSSSLLSIFFVSDLSNAVSRMNVSDLRRKCILIPENDVFYCIPMVHSISEQ